MMTGTKCLVMDPEDDTWHPGVIVHVSADGSAYKVQYRTKVATLSPERVKPAVTQSETPPELRGRSSTDGSDTGAHNHSNSQELRRDATSPEGGVSPLKKGPLLLPAREREGVSHTTITTRTHTDLTLTEGAGDFDEADLV